MQQDDVNTILGHQSYPATTPTIFIELFDSISFLIVKEFCIYIYIDIYLFNSHFELPYFPSELLVLTSTEKGQ